MDITYNIQNLGNNILLLTEDTSIDAPYFLAVITDPWTATIKSAVITPQGCDKAWELNFVGVNENYEDLLSGEIFFDNLGTWKAAIYEQSGAANTNADNAIFLININLQVQ